MSTVVYLLIHIPAQEDMAVHSGLLKASVLFLVDIYIFRYCSENMSPLINLEVYSFDSPCCEPASDDPLLTHLTDLSFQDLGVLFSGLTLLWTTLFWNILKLNSILMLNFKALRESFKFSSFSWRNILSPVNFFQLLLEISYRHTKDFGDGGVSLQRPPELTPFFYCSGGY